MLIIVINDDDNMLSIERSFTFVIKPINEEDKSNIVWRQVKAIVKPKKTIINVRICRRNSLLNLFSMPNKAIKFSFILSSFNIV